MSAERPRCIRLLLYIALADMVDESLMVQLSFGEASYRSVTSSLRSVKGMYTTMRPSLDATSYVVRLKKTLKMGH